MEFLSLINTDVEAARELIEDIESEHTSPEGKLIFFRQLSKLVSSQANAEKATVLDFALQHAERAHDHLRPAALEALEENALAEEFANRIRQTDDLDAWEAKVKVYCDLVHHQLQEKQSHILPELARHFEPKEVDQLAERYMRLREASGY